MKRALSLVLSVLLVVGLFALPVSAAELQATVGSVKAVASGVSYNDTFGAYAPVFTSLTAKDTNGNTLNFSGLVTGGGMYKKAYLYTENKLTTTPERGVTYYSYLKIELYEENMYDLGWDLGSYTNPNISITIPGYDVEFYDWMEREMGSYLEIKYTLTPKKIKVGSVNAVASGVEYDAVNDAYKPVFTSITAKDTDDKAVVIDNLFETGCFYENANLTNEVDFVPQAGDAYYSYIKMQLSSVGVDWELDIEDVTITIPGCDVTVEGFVEREMGSFLSIYFSVKPNVYIDSIKATASGFAYDGTEAAYAPEFTSFEVKDTNGNLIDMPGLIDATVFYKTASYSSANKLTTVPKVGEPCYGSIRVRTYRYGVGYHNLDMDDVVIVIPGFDVEITAYALREESTYVEYCYKATRQATANIVTEPKNAYVKDGETAKVTVEATGDGLTYTWYIKNAGSTKYSKSSITKATYSAKMSDKVHNRYLYCVVTDKYGNSVRTKTVLMRMQATITSESATASYAQLGAKVSAKVAAKGDGLTYTWYIKNDGGSKYSKSSVTSATYTTNMSSTSKNRKAYCVVKDKYGKTAQSKTFILRESVSITTQPKNTTVKNGATAKVTVKASGDGLSYTWYIKNAGQTSYSKSSVTKSTYSTTMNSKSKNRLVYCVVKDKYGKTVKSTTVQLKMK